VSRAGDALRAIAALALFSVPLLSQDPRLKTRLDHPTFVAVSALVDSARVAKLPTAPLVDKALEGAAKGSDGAKIVTAVKQLSVRMGSAKHVLGSSASADEIKSAAGAMDAGLSEHDLARLHAAGGKRPITMPLAVVSDLIAQSVPIPTVTDLVLQLVKSHVPDRSLTLLQRNVRTDVERGADPTVAATTRVRGLLVSAANPPAKPKE
jgi:hypothetical protein